MTTSSNSDTNPFEAIRASIEYIEGKGYRPDFMAMHPTLWGKFVTSTYVRLLDTSLKKRFFRLNPVAGTKKIPK
jgi:hypothetical protein